MPSLYISKMPLAWLCAITILFSGVGAEARPRTLSGRAYAIDGDTLVIRGVHVRLFGIDAFEHDQVCGRLACGRQATAVMRDMVRGRRVTCEKQAVDGYGRVVAICKLHDGRDIGGEMVRRGLAVAYRRYSGRYLADETVARKARAGAWAHGFQSPVEYRRAHGRPISSP